MNYSAAMQMVQRVKDPQERAVMRTYVRLAFERKPSVRDVRSALSWLIGSEWREVVRAFPDGEWYLGSDKGLRVLLDETMSEHHSDYRDLPLGRESQAILDELSWEERQRD